MMIIKRFNIIKDIVKDGLLSSVGYFDILSSGLPKVEFLWPKPKVLSILLWLQMPKVYKG